MTVAPPSRATLLELLAFAVLAWLAAVGTTGMIRLALPDPVLDASAVDEPAPPVAATAPLEAYRAIATRDAFNGGAAARSGPAPALRLWGVGMFARGRTPSSRTRLPDTRRSTASETRSADLGWPPSSGIASRCDRLHDVPSVERTAVALVPQSLDHVFGPVDLRRFPQAGRSGPRRRCEARMSILRSLCIASLAAIAMLGAVAGVHAQTATVDDTAKFLAGMMPSADSPLTPLTQEAAWQRHA